MRQACEKRFARANGQLAWKSGEQVGRVFEWALNVDMEENINIAGDRKVSPLGEWNEIALKKEYFSFHKVME